jgi:hypothetical protein
LTPARGGGRRGGRGRGNVVAVVSLDHLLRHSLDSQPGDRGAVADGALEGKQLWRRAQPRMLGLGRHSLRCRLDRLPVGSSFPLHGPTPFSEVVSFPRYAPVAILDAE